MIIKLYKYINKENLRLFCLHNLPESGLFAQVYSMWVQSVKILLANPKCELNIKLICSQFGYCSYNFAIAKVFAIIGYMDVFCTAFNIFIALPTTVQEW